MLPEPRCYARNCKHFIGAAEGPDGGEVGEHVVCAAFPKGIPDDIAFGENLHLQPVEGDGGIQYEEEAAEGQ